MWCLFCPRSRGTRCSKLPPYHTSISSTPIRTSTYAPINRAGTE
jgi:hypothetical protein